MTYEIILVFIYLVKFSAHGYKAKHRSLSAIAKTFVLQRLDRNGKREEAELCNKIETIINEWIDTERVF